MKNLINFEKIIEKILSQRRNFTRNDLLRLVEEKKREAQGLLSDEGAARLVAQDLLVKVDSKISEVKIEDLVSGLNDVTLTARVIAQWPIQEFRKQDGTSGRLLKLILGDKTGTIRCTLWNSKAEQASATGNLQGRIVRVAHGYTRNGLLGTPELNLGERSEIKILPVEAEEYPDIHNFFKKITDVKLTDREVNITGTVTSPPRVSTFTKEEGAGKVLRTTLSDTSGTVNLIAWNDKAEELSNINVGETLQIVGGRVRADLAGSPEIHVGNGSLVSILRRLGDAQSTGQIRISDLKPHHKNLSMLVRVVGVSEPMAPKSGSERDRYGMLLVGDESGLIRLFLWDDKVTVAETVREGDVIHIEGAKAIQKRGEILVTIGKFGKLELNPKLVSGEAPGYPNRVMIRDLKDISRPVIVEGTLTGEPEVKTVHSKDGERIKVSNLYLDDGSGRVQLSFWRNLAEKTADLKSGMRVKIVGIIPKTKTSGELTMMSNPLTSIEIIEEKRELVDDPL
ncbi:MAG: OB-fold nucleic acid binding domain-containing protein [Candidatus Bathyarchaeia archaeon]